MAGTIITCGVYGFTATAFEQAIAAANPDVFVDIRRRRGVRGAEYSFANSLRLQGMLARHGIRYVHAIDVASSEAAMKREGVLDKQAGIARHDRDRLSDEFVREYQHDVLDRFDARGFVDALTEDGVVPQRLLLFCVERTPAACHRGLLAEEIHRQLGWERVDLVPETT